MPDVGCRQTKAFSLFSFRHISRQLTLKVFLLRFLSYNSILVVDREFLREQLTLVLKFLAKNVIIDLTLFFL